MSTNLVDIMAERAEEKVMRSIKVIAAAPCPVHREAFACSCAVAMATMTDWDHVWCKRIWCNMTFETELLSKDHAWTYTGSRESHDIFTTAEGMTPEQFVRKQVQEGIMKHFLAPSGKLNDTTQAMLELWIARNQQWREMYGTRDVATEKWIEEAYRDAPMQNVPKEATPADAKVGDVVNITEMVPSQIVSMETADRQHGFAATFTELQPADTKGWTPYGGCVEEVKLCHPGCKVGKAMFEAKLKDASKIALDLLEPRQGEVRFKLVVYGPERPPA